MRRLPAVLIVLAAIALCVAGCSSSASGPSGSDGGPDVFDIPGLAAFYEFNGDFTDASGNGHDFISAMRMHFITDHNGSLESALYLDDSNAINIADHSDFDFIGAFSVVAGSLKNIENSAYCCLVDKGYADGAWSVGVGGTVTPARKALYLYVGSQSQSFYLNEAIPVGQGTWVHFAVCFNDTTDQATFYINGEYAHTQTAATPATLGVNARDLLIGNSHWDDEYAGGVDQLALFGRELTADEVEVLYEYD